MKRTSQQNSQKRVYPVAYAFGYAIIFLMSFTAGIFAAEPPTTGASNGINPALLYWQAFSIHPELSAPNKRLLSNPPKDPYEAEDLAERFNDVFLLLHRAAASKAECDWGINPADGPRVQLPNVMKIRQVAQAAIVRAQLALEDHRPEDARRDLVAAFTFARWVGHDTSLVSVMIAISVEDLIAQCIATHLPQFDPAMLAGLERDLAAAPRPGTVAESMLFEKTSYMDWLFARLAEIQAAHPGADAVALQKMRGLLEETLEGTNKGTSFHHLVKESGGTAQGLVDYCRRVEPLFQESVALASARPEVVKPARELLQEHIQKSGHPLATLFISNVGKARMRELEMQAQRGMLRAAMARHLRGERGFTEVSDPFGKGPFQIKAVKEGIELQSALADHGIKATLTVVEKR